MNFRKRTMGYILVAAAVLLGLTFLADMLSFESVLANHSGISVFDVLLSQIGNTLIVLSLTSVLSSDFGQVYWVDVKESRLITPFWGCFTGITVYLLTGLVFSLISFAAGCLSGVMISAIAATVLLIFLTYKMISIYFGKEQLKKGLYYTYKKQLVLLKSPYADDYLRRLKQFVEECESVQFPNKRSFLKKLKREIRDLEIWLFSEDKEVFERAHKQHVENFTKCVEEVQEKDLKLLECTRNAIINNNTEVVRENVELLVETENYNTFFKIVEELFDWDEEYACRMLKQISQRNGVWNVKEKLSYFFEYAFQKLIRDNGKLDALKNLLAIYDSGNGGMRQIRSSLGEVIEKFTQLEDKATQLDREASCVDDVKEMVRQGKQNRALIAEERRVLTQQWYQIVGNRTGKEMREYYLPVKELVTAYRSGEYRLVNKLINVLLINYKDDVNNIYLESGIEYTDGSEKISFSYVTEDEKKELLALFELDREANIISEAFKNELKGWFEVEIAKEC